VPTLHRDPEYIFLLVGLIGTTITPYMQLYQQSSIVERGSARRHYGPERLDAYLGVGFSNTNPPADTADPNRFGPPVGYERQRDHSPLQAVCDVL
jgi:hypothetical protein